MGPPVLRAIDTSSILDKVDVREKTLSGFLHTLRALWRTGAESGKVGRESRSGRQGMREEKLLVPWVFGPCPLTNYERQ